MIQSLLIGKAERIRFLLYIFSQRLPDISGAVILGDPQALSTGTSQRKVRFWSTQLHQYQSPENTKGVQIQEGALDIPDSMRQDTVELPRSFRHDNGVGYVLLVGDPATAAIFVRIDTRQESGTSGLGLPGFIDSGPQMVFRFEAYLLRVAHPVPVTRDTMVATA